ncbi:unnamed protein product, partial [Mesorhabditis belari]|uniref:Uncharacterized protein n=1 Tax=Mesorhabditis belari TaxID=2138241 RepID=A0AAF3ED80_9BILA
MSDEGNFIKKVPTKETQKIFSSQVIQSLSSALRQLIDNSLDAGATIIDIRSQQNGYEWLEVDDNGSGIGRENFEKLCKPHATSKLTNFEGLSSLETLGFRGEALHSMALLGKVTITTRTAEDDVGTRLVYKEAEISEETSIARQIGTTVRIDNLFYSLPVRRKEFEKNQKKEFIRLLNIVQEYALLYMNVKFLLSNTINGKRTVLIATPGGSTSDLKNVVTSLFGGSSDRTQMVAVKWDGSIDEGVQHDYNMRTEHVDFIKISGYISSCAHGNGRSSTDRQFIYANRRPVDLPKVSRVINEVYQSYNKSQLPVFVIEIEVPLSWIEVNVTPDKRMIFFSDEKLMLAAMKSAILATFAPLLGAQTSCQTQERLGNETMTQNPETELLQSPALLSPQGVPSVFDFMKDSSAKSQKRPIRTFHEQIKRSKLTAEDLGTPSLVPWNLADFLYSSPGSSQDKRGLSWAKKQSDSSKETKIDSIFLPKVRPNQEDIEMEPRESTSGDRREEHQGDDRSFERHIFYEKPQNAEEDEAQIKEERYTQMSQLREEIEGNDDGQREDIDLFDTSIHRTMQKPQNAEEDEAQFKEEVYTQMSQVREEMEGNDDGSQDDEDLFDTTIQRTMQKITFDRSRLFKRLRELQDDEKETKENDKGNGDATKVFDAEISSENANEAERELEQALSKSDFSSMRVIGQFNRGFIITQLEQHLFIVDQHAADEKFNFERFTKTARVGSQKMIKPQNLQLGAVDEAALYDNNHIFEANGFEFEFGDDGVYLVSLPVLTKYQFDRSDIDEILTSVTEHPNQMYRPQKLRKIFASRACRHSVMVGDTLMSGKMEEIVSNLGLLDHPWSCPHGRPTLRHLFDLRKGGFK